MTKLTKDQVEFLKQIGVPIEKTFNATGMSRTHYSKIMKSQSFEIAYGVTPCSRNNHTLRTRAGNCVQCNTANLRFQNRHRENGYLYLATSKVGGVVKFGVTQNISERKKTLNETKYGGFIDWKIITYSNCAECGKVEKLIHSEISHLRVVAEYSKNGKMQSAYELFKVPLNKALVLFNKFTG